MSTAPVALRRPLPTLGDPETLPSSARAARDALPVALVCMPFVSYHSPSIQIGLLKPIVASHGFPVRTLHLNLDFAALVGPDVYEELCDFGRVPVGDWLFAAAAFGDDAPDAGQEFLDEFPADVDRILRTVGRSRDWLLALRDVEVPRYLDWLMEAVDWGRFAVVGFTSTFQQNAASFALARRIKERHPGITTVFGGANFEDEMGLELVRSVRCIDYAVVGEGDLAFPQLLVALAEGDDPGRVAGVAFRDEHGSVARPEARPLFEALDELPTPDYQEYFDRAAFLRVFAPARAEQVMVPFESARGCWWGQHKHCTFCGLNGMGMRFRSKRPDRVLRELGELRAQYGVETFIAVDNIIDASYFTRLLPQLATQGAPYKIFYEVKANLTRDHIRLLRDAGVVAIQPGIESLSTHILQLMRKGVTAAQNVNTLRWCAYYGVSANWNVLFGFPGETAEDHAEQAGLMSLVPHLRPPGAVGPIWMERFSPMFTDRASFPARWMRPKGWYRSIYPAAVDLGRVAYFFDYELEGTAPESAFSETVAAGARWQGAWAGEPRPAMTFEGADGQVRVVDGRIPAAPAVHELEGLAASLYALCSDRPLTAERAGRALDVSEADAEAALQGMCDQRLTLRDGRLFLSLALPAAEDPASPLSTIDT